MYSVSRIPIRVRLSWIVGSVPVPVLWRMSRHYGAPAPANVTDHRSEPVAVGMPTGISILDSGTTPIYTHPPDVSRPTSFSLHFLHHFSIFSVPPLRRGPGWGAPDASGQLDRRKLGSEGDLCKHLPARPQPGILLARPRLTPPALATPRRPLGPAAASPRTTAASIDLRQQQPVVPGVLHQPPPFFTNRCWRLVNDHLPTRNRRTTHRHRFPRL